jgi:arylsulfatase A-like enzyme
MHGFDNWWVTERSAPTTDLNCACFNEKLCTLGHYRNTPPCTNYHSQHNEQGILQKLEDPILGDDSHFLVTLVEEFLQSVTAQDKPFFIYLPFHTVHIRYIASMGYIEQYTNLSDTQDEVDYFGAIMAMDAAIGLVRDLLKKYNVSDNTMLWFVSDNGPLKGTPGRTDGFRGWKTELYEGGIRVPGIIEWPAVVPSNRASDFAVVASDLLPTVCDILNISVPSDRTIDGESILPLIRQEKSTRNKTIAWAFDIHDGDFNGTYHAAISGDRYKVFAQYSNGTVKSAELYDLIDDPYETTDISDKNPQISKEYRELLETWRQSVYSSAQEVGCLGVSKQVNCKC